MGVYKITDPQTGKSFRITKPGDVPPTQDEISQVFTHFSPQNDPLEDKANFESTGFPSIDKAERGIAKRESLIKGFKGRAERGELFGGEDATLGERAKATGLSALLGLGAGFEAGESIPANIGLAAQRGDFTRLPKDIFKSITGERPAQIGDIVRGSGLPPQMAEPLAAVSGLMLTGGTTAVPRKGAGLVSKAAAKSVNVVRAPTNLPVQGISKSLGLGGKFVGKTFDVATKPIRKGIRDIDVFPYKTSLIIKKNLVRYFKRINRQYARRLEEIAEKAPGGVPAESIASPIKHRLQQLGLLDLDGKVMSSRLEAASRAEKELIRIYQNASKNTGNISIKGVVGEMKRLRRMIRESAKKGTNPLNPDDRLLANVRQDLGKSLEPFLGNDLKILNRNYATNRELFNAGNRIFKVFSDDFDTLRGEKAITNFVEMNEGTQALLVKLEQELGMNFIEAAKRFSSFAQAKDIPVVGRLTTGTAGLGRGLALTGKEAAKRSAKPQLGATGTREALKAFGLSE